MEIKNIKGKRIKEVINKDTQICDKFVDGWDNDVIKNPLNFSFQDITVLCDSVYVFIFDREKLKAIFCVYELEHIFFNKKRGVVTAIGHETLHEYWLDDGEYNKKYIR